MWYDAINRIYNTTNICFPKNDANVIIGRLKNIAISNGSACTSSIVEPSHVLSAMGLENDLALASLRFSLSKYNNMDEVKKVVEETEIESVDSVYHKNMVKLIFSNDTITCTKDHPFYIENKGWCSLYPQKTLNNYSNYSKVVKIQKNDLFIFRNGVEIAANKLIDIIDLKDDYGQMTYTITRLKKGNSYFANGILTGVEHLKNEIIGQSK